MKRFLFIMLIIIISCISFVLVKKINSPKLDINYFDVEINTIHKVKEFIKDIKNGKITNEDEEILFNKLGEKEITINYVDNFDNKKEVKINIKVGDTEKPVITAKENITIIEGNKIDLLSYVKVTDNSKEDIVPEVSGEYNINKSGTYKLKYIAKDLSGNTSEFAFNLIVKAKKKEVITNTTKSLSKYYIKVNKTLNVVMVYNLDTNNNYTNLVKTFVCSAGNNTPLGTYTIDAKAETLALEGGVYGHFTVRFLKSRGMWFHSVPYFSKPTKNNPHWDNLEYEEYNKLGSLASLGCIRLAVIDAKWIYDNVSKGTIVEIYESDSLPSGVIKPTPIKIDVNSEYRGWDPTDPDSSNPWKK